MTHQPDPNAIILLSEAEAARRLHQAAIGNARDQKGEDDS